MRYASEFPGGDPNAADDDDHAGGCVSADLVSRLGVLMGSSKAEKRVSHMGFPIFLSRLV